MGAIERIREEARQEGLQKGRKEGRQEGMQKGRQEGMQKGRQEVILNLLKKKQEISFISEVTGLPEKEIEKLKSKS